MTRNFLNIDEVMAMHADLLTQFGGEPGLCDLNALESALMWPHTGYYAGLTEGAAALMESLAMNHPLGDGNKRVAFFATDTFLRMNGHYIDCDRQEAHEVVMSLFDTNSFRFTELASWLAENAKPI